MKVIEKIREAINNDTTVFSFEFFPPKTEDGVDNLFQCMDRMAAHNPTFYDITWGVGGSTADLTLEIANKKHNIVCVETMMHLTCTNMSLEKIDHALRSIKSNGIQNDLALHGDPLHGEDKFVQIQGGYAYDLDLVKHIMENYGAYFGITVACYPGWGGPGGYIYQKAYLEFFCSKEKLNALVNICKGFPSLTYMAVNRDGCLVSNVGLANVNAVTWGVDAAEIRAKNKKLT